MEYSVGITVKTNSMSYAANHVQIIRKGWDDDYNQFVVSFECSGVHMAINVQDVVSIDYHCNEIPVKVVN